MSTTMKQKRIYIIFIIIFAIGAVIGYFSHQNRYHTLLPNDYKFNCQSSSYTIMETDSNFIKIHKPQTTRNGIELKIDVLEPDFIPNISPLVVFIDRQEKRDREFFYDLNFIRNKILIKNSDIDKENSILRIGYYKYEDIYSSKECYFYCRSYEIQKKQEKILWIARYTKDDPIREDERVILHAIHEVKMPLYVYGYTIDETFNGFKDNNNTPLSGYNSLKLKHGSSYKGNMSNGYFEGKGTFVDLLLNKTYTGNFTEGTLKRDSIINDSQVVKITEYPLLSIKYPVDHKYREELYQTNGVTIEKISYYYSPTGNYKEIKTK